jgi:hypothetical protein
MPWCDPEQCPNSAKSSGTLAGSQLSETAIRGRRKNHKFHYRSALVGQHLPPDQPHQAPWFALEMLDTATDPSCIVSSDRVGFESGIRTDPTRHVQRHRLRREREVPDSVVVWASFALDFKPVIHIWLTGAYAAQYRETVKESYLIPMTNNQDRKAK